SLETQRNTYHQRGFTFNSNRFVTNKPDRGIWESCCHPGETPPGLLFTRLLIVFAMIITPGPQPRRHGR
ncbi:MAG TPA: hypothetical protein VJS86_05530, partial [Arthrobacter sp.]|nr:hypothetical protein [Arthrobacter sp.]